jgi:quinol monooxygenase YgiN
MSMHVQIVTFQLQGLDEAQYRAACAELAPLFADLPGLHAKIWLANPHTNTFGGVYLWQDRAAMQAYCASDLFGGAQAHPNFARFSSTDYPILGEQTLQTWMVGDAGAPQPSFYQEA